MEDALFGDPLQWKHLKGGGGGGEGRGEELMNSWHMKSGMDKEKYAYNSCVKICL
jgi:hypothetical protein